MAMRATTLATAVTAKGMGTTLATQDTTPLATIVQDTVMVRVMRVTMHLVMIALRMATRLMATPMATARATGKERPQHSRRYLGPAAAEAVAAQGRCK